MGNLQKRLTSTRTRHGAAVGTSKSRLDLEWPDMTRGKLTRIVG